MEISELIRQISEVAPRVWQISVRQAIVDGIYHLFFSAALLFALVKTSAAAKNEFGHEAIDPDGGLAVVFTITAVAISITLSFSLYVAVSNLLNPEYAAAKMIIEMLK